MIDVHALDGVPLLLLGPGFATRQTLDAACRLAGVRALVRFESASLSTLAAFAEAGHGVAIVPGAFRRNGERVRISKLEFRRKQVTLPMAILWDSKKPLPRFAESFPAMFAAHAKTLMLGEN